MKQKIASDSIYSAISGVFLISANFICGVMVANILGVDDTGNFYFIIALCLLISTILDGGAASSVVRFQAALMGKNDMPGASALAGRIARRLVIYTALGLSFLLALLTLSPASLLSELSLATEEHAHEFHVWFLPLLAISVSVQVMAVFATAYLRGSRNFRTLAGLSLVSMIVQLSLVCACALTIGVDGAIIGYGLGQAPLAIVTLSLLFRRGEVERSVIPEVRHYQRFAWAANVCNIFVWSRIEIFLLQYFWGPREVGLFSIALALSALASQGPMLMTGSFLPLLSERHGKGDHAGLQRAFSGGTRLLAMFAFPACMGMVAILPIVVEIIYGSQFAPAVPAAMMVCAAAAISVTAVIGTHLVSALARSDFIFYTSLLGAFLSVIVGLSIIPPLGLVGAAIARSTTQIIMICIGVWFIVTRLRFAYPFAELLRILLATLPATGTAYLAAQLVGGPIGMVAAAVLFIPVYLVGLRVFSALSPSDADLLQALNQKLPRLPARAVHHLLLAIGSTRPAPRNINPAE
jgi:O-antigen/teichoic acid export membrane protein